MSVLLWPASGVHLAAVGPDIIVLDIERDAYQCLLGAAAALDLRPDGRIVAAGAEIAAALHDAGLTSSRPPLRPRRAAIVPRDELRPSSPPDPFGTAAAALDLARDALAFRGRPLAALLAAARRPSTISPADPARVLHAAAAAVAAARPWVPFEGECLQRGFQLKRALARRGVAADWVFGVRTWPFGAHCWIQSGALVVGDTVARVSAYTPILVA